MKQSQYMDVNSSRDESELLKQRMQLLYELLNNRTPICPYEGTVKQGCEDHCYNEFTAITNKIRLIFWSLMITSLQKPLRL